MENPLLSQNEYTRYDQIKAQHFVPGITAVVERCRNKITTITKIDPNKRAFGNTFQIISDIEEEIAATIVPATEFNGVAANPEIRDAYMQAKHIVVDFQSEMNANAELYEVLRLFRDENTLLNSEQSRFSDECLKNFKLAGAHLKDSKKSRLGAINSRMAELQTRFTNNVTDSVDAIHISEADDLKGLPKDSIAAAHDRAIAENKTQDNANAGWLFTTEPAIMLPFMQFADNDKWRKELYLKSNQRALNGATDNRPIIEEILKLRREKATLLDFEDYAHLSIARKAAPSPADVIDFLSRFANKLRPHARDEYDALCYIKKYHTGEVTKEITAWEMAYWANKLKERKFKFSDNDTKPYFSLNDCVEGMFDVARLLYQIHIVEITDIPKIHADVKAYRLSEKNGDPIAILYTDFFARTGSKRAGAWMGLLRPSKQTLGKRQTPHVTICTNFAKGSESQPALLTHRELRTLFHEFGHALHGMFSRTQLAALASPNVAWDTVELPSQFFENWIWQKEVLQQFGRHHETGETIPDELINKMITARNFMTATAYMRQISFSMFDLTLHAASFSGNNASDVHALWKDTYDDFSFVPFVDETHFETVFAHIFAGGYSAGYYSYLWAEVLAADAFEVFIEDGDILNTQIAKRFRQEILEKGNSLEMDDLYQNFRGKAATEDALLKRAGL